MWFLKCQFMLVMHPIFWSSKMALGLKNSTVEHRSLLKEVFLRVNRGLSAPGHRVACYECEFCAQTQAYRVRIGVTGAPLVTRRAPCCRLWARTACRTTGLNREV